MTQYRVLNQRTSRVSLCTAITLVLALTGCKSAPAPATQTQTQTQTTQIDPATAGSVSGVVHFEGKAPERVAIDMDQDPACSLGSSSPNLTEQIVTTGGKLQNVFIYVKSGVKGTYAPPRTPVVLDQQGCRYVPHVLGIMTGQPLEVRNSDVTMHNVHPESAVAGQKVFDVSQGPKGKPVQVFFDKPELMMPIRCNNHPWMQAFLNVTDNPFYAVSNADGTFTITGLPPGTYTLTAVQEKLGTQTATVTVTTGKATPQDFTFKAN